MFGYLTAVLHFVHPPSPAHAQYELKVTTLTEKLEESESRKRQLQELNDQRGSELAVLRANEQLMTGEQNQQILAGQSSIRAKLDEEFKRQSEMYAAQVKELRDEVDAKQLKLEQLTE